MPPGTGRMTSPGWPANNARDCCATPGWLTSLADDLGSGLDNLGLDTRTGLDVLMTLNTYVLGAVIRELQEMRSEQDLQAIPDRRVVDAGILQWQESLRASGRFTRFLRIFDEDIDPDSPETREERFEFGLGCMLDGIASQIERQGS